MAGLHDMAKMSVSGTPGTGTITLGSAVSGYQTFAAAGVVDGEVVSYSILDGTNWEVGRGTYTASGATLSRGPLFSNANNAAINASSSAVVWIAPLAEDFKISALQDTNTPFPSDKDVLTYVAADGKWENKPALSGLTVNAVVVGGGSRAPTVEPDWKFSSHVLIGDLNAAALPPGPSGTVLQIGNADANTTRFVLDNFGDSTVIGNVTFRKARNTAASPSAVQSGDAMGQFSFFGYGAAGYSAAARASMRASAIENWSDTAQGSNYTISTTPAGSTTLGTVATFASAGCSFIGTNANDSAAAGNIGEYVSSTVGSGSAVNVTSGVAANVTSISLTAGDWDVEGVVALSPAGTTVTTRANAAISTTSATLPSLGSLGYTRASGTQETGVTTAMSTGTVRLSLSATTTVYLVAAAVFTTSTQSAYGSIRARRMR
jgi:hypothetical protein